MKTFLTIVFAIVLEVIVAAIASLITGALFMVLWNLLIGAGGIFGLSFTINYGTSYLICLLATMLFGHSNVKFSQN